MRNAGSASSAAPGRPPRWGCWRVTYRNSSKALRLLSMWAEHLLAEQSWPCCLLMRNLPSALMTLAAALDEGLVRVGVGGRPGAVTGAVAWTGVAGARVSRRIVPGGAAAKPRRKPLSANRTHIPCCPPGSKGCSRGRRPAPGALGPPGQERY